MLSIRSLDDKFVILSHLVTEIFDIIPKRDKLGQRKVLLKIADSHSNCGIDTRDKDLKHGLAVIANSAVCSFPTEMLALGKECVPSRLGQAFLGTLHDHEGTCLPEEHGLMVIVRSGSDG